MGKHAGSYEEPPGATGGTGPRPDHEAVDAEAARERAALVRKIDLVGGFDGDSVWRDVFARVPRHRFVPWYHLGVAGGYERLWGEDPDPAVRARWLRGAYADVPLGTRLADDGTLISSSSQPSLMARMLVDLGVRDGDRVLEIGTGTGYNAALLGERLGDAQVTTIDLDADITGPARQRLADTGHSPAVVTGDGFLGCDAHAPYDRIMATCTIGSIPWAWLEQSAPGARILAPLATGLIALDVAGPREAEGRFLTTPAFFVPLRGAGEPEHDSLALSGLPRSLLDDEGFRFFATLSAHAMDPEEALAVWESEGAPPRERFGITVHSDRQWAWLDDPEGPYTWQL